MRLVQMLFYIPTKAVALTVIYLSWNAHEEV